jgi:hypothetical protein
VGIQSQTGGYHEDVSSKVPECDYQKHPLGTECRNRASVEMQNDMEGECENVRTDDYDQ